MKAINLSYISNDSVLNPSIDRRSEIFLWSLTGKDNQLPSIIEHLALESPTAKACIQKNLNAIIGKGFQNGNFRVHANGTTLNQIGRQIGRSIATHANAFLHVTYDGNLDLKGLRFLPTKECRIGKDDDTGYSGKIVLADWSASRITSMNPIDVFNPNKEVIQSQIEKAGSLSQYKGQILHISKDNSFKYAPSDLYPVLELMEAEKLSKTFLLNGAKFGFLNQKLVVVADMTEDEERAFKSSLKKQQGADNSNNMMVLKATSANADLKNQILVSDLTGNPDDKVLAYTDAQAEAQICKAMGVPVSMISSKDNGIFGQSGELLKSMKIELYEQQEYSRMLIEESINMLLSRFQTKIEPQFIIDPFKIEA